jgi:flagellar protein FlgJ
MDSPIFPSVRIAQTIQETGGVIHPWNNIVGFKVGNGKPNGFWKGDSVNLRTWEVYDNKTEYMTDSFRAYDSVEDCLMDQDLLFQLSRYERVRTARTPELQADALRLCGYATDPNYASAIISIIHRYALKQFDEEAFIVLDKIEQLQQQVNDLQNKVNDLEQLASMKQPEWAADAVKRALALGIIDTPDNGSFDFYRFLTVMYRKGLL